jgi:hypothetical protein
VKGTTRGRCSFHRYRYGMGKSYLQVTHGKPYPFIFQRTDTRQC